MNIFILSLIISLILGFAIIFLGLLWLDYHITKKVYGRRLTLEEVKSYLKATDGHRRINGMIPTMMVIGELNTASISSVTGEINTEQLNFYSRDTFSIFDYPFGDFYQIYSKDLKGIVIQKWDREAYNLLYNEHQRLLKEYNKNSD